MICFCLENSKTTINVFNIYQNSVSQILSILKTKKKWLIPIIGLSKSVGFKGLHNKWK